MKILKKLCSKCLAGLLAASTILSAVPVTAVYAAPDTFQAVNESVNAQRSDAATVSRAVAAVNKARRTGSEEDIKTAMGSVVNTGNGPLGEVDYSKAREAAETDHLDIDTIGRYVITENEYGDTERPEPGSEPEQCDSAGKRRENTDDPAPAGDSSEEVEVAPVGDPTETVEAASEGEPKEEVEPVMQEEPAQVSDPLPESEIAEDESGKEEPASDDLPSYNESSDDSDNEDPDDENDEK